MFISDNYAIGDQMNEIQVLLKFEESSKWFQSHIDDLRKNYENKFVAIKDKKVIGSSKDIEDIINRLEQKNEKPNEIIIELITPQNLKILLW